MKYKVTLNGRTYEVEVEAGKAMCVAEYEAFVPAAPAPVAAAPVAAAPVAAPAVAPVAAAPAATEVAPGTAGKLKLYDTPPKTAAMIMAIVADKMGKPLNELRFISIKEVK
jgi:glutaconyl-CoA decarboxylase